MNRISELGVSEQGSPEIGVFRCFSAYFNGWREEDKKVTSPTEPPVEGLPPKSDWSLASCSAPDTGTTTGGFK